MKRIIAALLIIGCLIWIGQGNNGQKLGDAGGSVAETGIDAGGGIADAVVGTIDGLTK